MTMDAMEEGFPSQMLFFITCMAEKYIPTPGTFRTIEGARPFHNPPSFSVVRMFFVINIIPGDVPWLVWILVFSRSRGWKRTVEQVPLKDPARNALTMGACTAEERIALGTEFSSSFKLIFLLVLLLIAEKYLRSQEYNQYFNTDGIKNLLHYDF